MQAKGLQPAQPRPLQALRIRTQASELRPSKSSRLNLIARNLLAHELQHAVEDGDMATKMKLLKMLQEVKGLAQITNRRPAPRPPMLFLMQLRANANQPSLPRRRLAIEKGKETGHLPLPIKIHHIRPDDPGLPVVIQ